MTPQELKNSILQLAIQGKLVEQRPEEGTAGELYRQIQAEKQTLIKARKIKKEKPLPEITEDETPFDIPESWMWVRVGNIGSWSAGATPSRTNAEYYNGSIPWLKTGDLNDGYVSEVPESISTLALEKTSVRLNPVGSVLMAMYGATIGKLAILNVPMTTNQACCACIPFGDMFNKYLFYYLMGMRKAFIKMGEGGAQPNISKEKIVISLMPLPPLEEQKRIVAKIEELLPLINRYEKAWSRLEDFNKRFPGDMQKSILQMAIQGKLVEQCPEEGTGEEHLKKCVSEKKELSKTGIFKGRKSKALQEIDKNNVPFDLPDNWIWVRLGNLVEIFGRIGFRGYTKQDIVKKGEGAITISPSNIDPSGKTVFDDCTYLSWDKYEESPEIKINNGDIIMVKTGSSYGKCGIVYNLPEKATINPQLAVLKYVFCNAEYLNYALKTPMARTQYEQFVIGTSIPTFSQEKLANMLIPLPPLAEQKRIVARLEELLPLCERLK